MPEDEKKQGPLLVVRSGTEEDLPRLMELFRQARQIMRADGNTEQWAGEYPSRDVVLEDIRHGHCFVVEKSRDGSAEEYGVNVVGTLAFIPGIEPTYNRIYENEFKEGQPAPRLAAWLDDTLRVDTHAHNHIMQHCIQKAGFTYCCIIYLADGSPRLEHIRNSPNNSLARAPDTYR